MLTGLNNKHIGKCILFCNCNGERIKPELLHAVDKSLKKLPLKVIKVTDLCSTLLVRNENLQKLLTDNNEYLILGCYMRSMDMLLKKASITASYKHINLIETEQEEVLRMITDFSNTSREETSYQEISQESEWPAWYPLIDYSRCTACGQCADFCLFGVYEKSAEGVKVVNPGNCKINCPACARICPSMAIIFPKYKYGGAVGGSDLISEADEHQRQLKDIENLLGDNIYDALQKRKAKRKSIIREDAMKKAFEERDRALKRDRNK